MYKKLKTSFYFNIALIGSIIFAAIWRFVPMLAPTNQNLVLASLILSIFGIIAYITFKVINSVIIYQVLCESSKQESFFAILLICAVFELASLIYLPFWMKRNKYIKPQPIMEAEIFDEAR